MSQRIVIPTVVQAGDGKRPKWGLFTALLITSLALIMLSASMEPDLDELDECNAYGYNPSERCEDLREERSSSDLVGGFGGLFCCGAIIIAIMSISAGSASSRTVIVNQGYTPQATVVQTNQQMIQSGGGTRMPAGGQMPLEANRLKPNNQSTNSAMINRPDKASQAPSSTPSMDEIDKIAREAKNLELARDFAKAAELYQKAGLFAEAGRVRQTYLENDKPVVQIGQIGDSVVKDSVIMGDKSSNLCAKCGVVTQPEWNFCPACNSPL